MQSALGLQLAVAFAHSSTAEIKQWAINDENHTRIFHYFI
jgi:hypothetical protein